MSRRNGEELRLRQKKSFQGDFRRLPGEYPVALCAVDSV